MNQHHQPIQMLPFNAASAIRNTIKNLYEYDGKVLTVFIEAVPAPRMTKGQLYMSNAPDHKLTKAQLAVKNRINRYTNFKTNLQLIASVAKFKMADTMHIVIGISTDKRERIGRPHQQKPDVDNCVKSVLDALCKDDSNIWDLRVTKIWSEKNFITIQPLQ